MKSLKKLERNSSIYEFNASLNDFLRCFIKSTKHKLTQPLLHFIKFHIFFVSWLLLRWCCKIETSNNEKCDTKRSIIKVALEFVVKYIRLHSMKLFGRWKKCLLSWMSVKWNVFFNVLSVEIWDFLRLGWDANHCKTILITIIVTSWNLKTKV